MAIRTVGSYPSKPFDCWQKCKELRADNYSDVMTAQEKGKILVTGSAHTPRELLAGFGEFVFLAGEPYGASCGNFQDFAQETFDAYEAAGFTRDHCAYLRAYMGSVFMDRYAFGGPFPRPDFAFTGHTCDTHGKWFQLVAEHLGIPFYVLDETHGDDAHRVEYMVAQFQDFIQWGEKLLGRKFDDDTLIEGVGNVLQVRALWGETTLMNQNIPAPMDIKSMYTFFAPEKLVRHRKEAVEFYTILRDEVKDRVAQGIAALATERCRLVHENVPPWFALHILRFMEKYGAVCVGSRYVMTGLVRLPGGAVRPHPTLKERGVVLHTREEALRELAQLMYGHDEDGFDCISKASTAVFVAKAWKADGVMWHLNRGCEGVSLGDMEARLAVIKELGLPTCVYEGNQGDRREWNEAQVLDRLQTFLEGTLGLERLVD